MDTTDRFSRWFPLDAPAPAVPGLVQLKIDGELVRYPTGASAMLRYDGGPSVAEAMSRAVGSLGERFPADRVRWRCQALPEGQVDAALAQLRARFVERFGAPPVLDDPR